MPASIKIKNTFYFEHDWKIFLFAFEIKVLLPIIEIESIDISNVKKSAQQNSCLVLLFEIAMLSISSISM